jgi:hypothetical protein
MGPELSVRAEARRVLLRALPIAALLIAVFAIAASGASAGKGVWKVGPGKTLMLSNMTIGACDSDIALIFVDGLQLDQLGTNAGNECATTSLPDYSFSSTDGTHTVTIQLVDNTAGCGWFSNGPNAVSTRKAVSINDGGGFCGILPPTLGEANFNAEVSIFRTP